MIRLLQLCKRAVFSSFLAGVLCGGPISNTAYSLSPPAQLPGIASEQTGDSIGVTYIDLQTRHSMPERLVYNPATQDVQLVWMADVEPDQSKSLRGTYFGVIDVSGDSPRVVELPTGWKRIETGKSGWPSISSFADGSVGVAAHAPLLFSKNLPSAYTAFTTSPKNLGATVYFRSAIDGSDIIHLIFTYSSGSEAGHLGYVRSEDKGQSWSAPLLLTGPAAPGGATPGIAGADCYAIAARGSKVVVIYADGERRLWKRESLNSGTGWQNPVVLHEPRYEYHITESIEGDTVLFVSDTVETAGTQMDIVLDQQGMSHVVFSLLATFVRGKGIDDGGIKRIGSDTVFIDREYIRTWGLGYLKEGSSQVERMGPPAGEQWNGTGRFLANSGDGGGAGYSCYPQLGIDAGGTVYCVYTSVQNNDLKQLTVNDGGEPVTVDALFGHIYATHKPLNHHWSRPVNLTPTGLDCLYGTLANTVDDNLYIGYQSDATPGIRIIHQTPLEEAVVRFRALPVELLNEAIPVSVQTPVTGFNHTSLSIAILPNPVTVYSHIAIDMSAAANVSVELYSMTGTRIATLFQGMLGTGRHSISLQKADLDRLAAGQYYCIVRTPDITKSEILSIVR